ncbi:two-component system regulatory protein YycI [Cohnella lupini]|uniref:Regulatory protein YycI of two-component signal transduction system YycFG n=1 Tax=Cohnella lupini TaxID=1294267 RepID=A0A3D9HYA7_9BACL|nr:two-component system regulatory protein YycI [Cohnella lupini]RED54492.1 regulatory protein YycI of two-component signal transduction system YycFG [Cohnella lupini]
MDWRRAKSVLIISFLMLNIVLGYQLWTDWRERLNTAVDWTSLPPETLLAMREKNIQVDDNATIPTETPAMREMTYTFKQRAGTGINDRTAIAATPETRFVFNQEELVVALGGIIPELGTYTLDVPGSREGVYFRFNRMQGGWPLFDIHLNLYYSEQKIRAYTQDLIEIKPSSGAKEQQVLPAAKALAKVIEVNLPAGSVIKEIRLGYHGEEIFNDAETQVSVPSWRVLLENGEEVYYVNAISAEVTTEKGEALVNP